MLNCLQWNVLGARSKKATLEETIRTGKYDIIILQETLLQQTQEFNLSGYKTFITYAGNSKRGLAILCKNRIPAKQIIRPISCGNNIEVMAIQITLMDTTLDVYNIYRPPHRDKQLNLVELLAHTSEQPTLIGGDFNAHHPILNSSSSTCENGEHIALMLEEFEEVTLLNNGRPTHIRGGRLDLTLITKPLRQFTQWEIHPTTMSDYFALSIRVQLPQLPPIPPPPPRWNQELADWTAFRGSLETWLRDYNPPDDIDQLELELVAAIQAAADQSMPKKNKGNYTYTDSWYYCPEVRSLKTRLNRARK